MLNIKKLKTIAVFIFTAVLFLSVSTVSYANYFMDTHSAMADTVVYDGKMYNVSEIINEKVKKLGYLEKALETMCTEEDDKWMRDFYFDTDEYLLEYVMTDKIFEGGEICAEMFNESPLIHTVIKAMQGEKERVIGTIYMHYDDDFKPHVFMALRPTPEFLKGETKVSFEDVFEYIEENPNQKYMFISRPSMFRASSDTALLIEKDGKFFVYDFDDSVFVGKDENVIYTWEEYIALRKAYEDKYPRQTGDGSLTDIVFGGGNGETSVGSENITDTVNALNDKPEKDEWDPTMVVLISVSSVFLIFVISLLTILKKKKS